MAITKDMYSRILGGVSTLGRARKKDSDMIMDVTWDGDIQSQVAYFFDYYHTTPDNRLRLEGFDPSTDSGPVPIEIKFIRNSRKTFEKDAVTHHIQFRPGHQCPIDYYKTAFGDRYNAKYPIGLYCWIRGEDDVYRRWLVVAAADVDENQFPTWEVLKCDNIYRWVKNGKFYEFPGVSRSQNSQIVRFVLEIMHRKFSIAENTYIKSISSETNYLLGRSTSKVRQVPENGNRLSPIMDMVLICSDLAGDREKIYLTIG